MRSTLSMFPFMMVLLGAGSVQAFDYDESVNGDLVDFAVPRLFDFDMGENVVSGSTLISSVSQTLDADLFAFRLPEGSQLSSVIFSYSSLSVSGPFVTISLTPSLWDRKPDGTWTGDPVGAVDVPIFTDGHTPDFVPQSSPVILNFLKHVDFDENVLPESTLPLGSGAYVFLAAPALNAVITGGGTTSVSWNYAYKFTVIPEPGTGILVGLGLLGLGLRRARPDF